MEEPDDDDTQYGEVYCSQLRARIDELEAMLLDQNIILNLTIEAYEKRLDKLKAMGASQAEDQSLWAIAETPVEALLQRALRSIHALIEQDSDMLIEVNQWPEKTPSQA